MKNLQQIPDVRSPTESVDSGVALSPCSNTYSSSEDLTAVVVENFFDLPELTSDEWESLSSDCVSPASSGESCLDSFTDINQFELIAEELPRSATSYHPYAAEPVEQRVLKPVENTNVTSSSRRRRKIKSCGGECYKGSVTDRCFVPKSGTAKPRQSHKKNKTGNVDHKVMKPIMSGARVKKTARERLAELRSRSSNTGGSQSPANQSLNVESHKYPVPSVTMSQYGCATSNPVQVSSASHVRHSVHQILQSSSQSHVSSFDDDVMRHRDGLQDGPEELINKAVLYGRVDELILYFQRNKSSSECGGSALHSIMVKVNQRKEIYTTEQMENLTKVLCERLSAMINTKNLRGETPLFQTAMHGNIGPMRALLIAGADPWIRENSVNKSSLDAAIWSKNPDAVDIILHHTAGGNCRNEINSASWDGNTPLHRATALREIDPLKQTKIISVLLSAGADPSSKNGMSEMPHTLLPPELRDLQDEMKKINSRRRAHTSHHRLAAMQPPPSYMHSQLQPPFHPAYPNIISSAFPMSLQQNQSFTFTSTLQSPNIFSPVNPAFTQAMEQVNPQFSVANSFPQMGNASLPSDFSVEDEFLDSFVNEGQ